MTSPESGLPSGSNIVGKSLTSTSSSYLKVEAADVLLDWVDFAYW